MDIEAKRKLYNRWWNESAFSGGDMDNLLDEVERLHKALQDIQRYNNDEVTNDRRIRYVIGEIVNKALEE